MAKLLINAARKNRARAGAHQDQEGRQVKVIAGRDKGKTGRVLEVDRRRGKVWSKP